MRLSIAFWDMNNNYDLTSTGNINDFGVMIENRWLYVGAQHLIKPLIDIFILNFSIDANDLKVITYPNNQVSPACISK